MGSKEARTALLAAALSAAPAGWTQEVPPVSGAPVGPSSQGVSSSSEAAWAKGLAVLYGSDVRLVQSLRALGLDHVETECVVAVSTRAQRPVTEVLELRRAGMEWGDIARSYGFGLLEAIRAAPAAGRRRSAPPVRERSRP